MGFQETSLGQRLTGMSEKRRKDSADPGNLSTESGRHIHSFVPACRNSQVRGIFDCGYLCSSDPILRNSQIRGIFDFGYREVVFWEGMTPWRMLGQPPQSHPTFDQNSMSILTRFAERFGYQTCSGLYETLICVKSLFRKCDSNMIRWRIRKISQTNTISINNLSNNTSKHQLNFRDFGWQNDANNFQKGDAPERSNAPKVGLEACMPRHPHPDNQFTPKRCRPSHQNQQVVDKSSRAHLIAKKRSAMLTYFKPYIIPSTIYSMVSKIPTCNKVYKHACVHVFLWSGRLGPRIFQGVWCVKSAAPGPFKSSVLQT